MSQRRSRLQLSNDRCAGVSGHAGINLRTSAQADKPTPGHLRRPAVNRPKLTFRCWLRSVGFMTLYGHSNLGGRERRVSPSPTRTCDTNATGGRPVADRRHESASRCFASASETPEEEMVALAHTRCALRNTPWAQLFVCIDNSSTQRCVIECANHWQGAVCTFTPVVVA